VEANVHVEVGVYTYWMHGPADCALASGSIDLGRLYITATSQSARIYTLFRVMPNRIITQSQNILEDSARSSESIGSPNFIPASLRFSSRLALDADSNLQGEAFRADQSAEGSRELLLRAMFES